MKSIKLFSDQAIGELNSQKIDGLDFSIYAEILAQSAIGSPGPFSIGIFGE